MGTAVQTYAEANGFEFMPYNKGNVNGSGDISPTDAAEVLGVYANVEQEKALHYS